MLHCYIQKRLMRLRYLKSKAKITRKTLQYGKQFRLNLLKKKKVLQWESPRASYQTNIGELVSLRKKTNPASTTNS